MSPTTSKLIHLLEQEYEVYSRLLDRLELEKSAMLGSKARQLMHLTNEKQELTAHLKRLERQRIALLSQIANQLQIPLKDLTIKKLLRYASAPEAGRLTSLRQDLTELIPKVRQANEESRSLIQHCMNLVQGSLSFLQHLISPPPVYGASGGISEGANSGHLLSGQV